MINHDGVVLMMMMMMMMVMMMLTGDHRENIIR